MLGEESRNFGASEFGASCPKSTSEVYLDRRAVKKEGHRPPLSLKEQLGIFPTDSYSKCSAVPTALPPAGIHYETPRLEEYRTPGFKDLKTLPYRFSLDPCTSNSAMVPSIIVPLKKGISVTSDACCMLA